MASQHLRLTSHILESLLKAWEQLVAESASQSPYALTAWGSVEDFRKASTIGSLSQPFTNTWTFYAGTPTNLYYLSHEELHPRDGVVISGTSIEKNGFAFTGGSTYHLRTSYLFIHASTSATFSIIPQ